MNPKKIITLISGIFNIVTSAILFVLMIISISEVIEICRSGGVNDARILILSVLFLDLAIYMLIIVFSSLLFADKNRKKNGLYITLIVLFSIWFISSFVGAVNIVGMIISLLCLGLEIAAMVVPDKIVKNNSANKTVNATASLSFEEKIAELKHFKELGVITEEQFSEASQKLLSEYTKN